MASAKRSLREVRPSYTPSGKPTVPGRNGLTLAVLAAGVAVVAFTATALMAAIFRFLEFYSGVFSLVALSLTVMGGLAATDRAVLLVRHRIMLQSAHRALATAAMVFLAVHIATKVVEGHARLLDIVVPFLASHRTLYVGLGTIASYLMVAVAVTGIARGRFAGTRRPWTWRALHVTAYACWPIALLHGLNAGRAAKGWVVLSYVLCLILVGLGLLVRLWVMWGTRLRTSRTRTRAVRHPDVRVATAVPTSPPSAAPVRPPEVRIPAPAPAPVGRWSNMDGETITDEEFWAYLRSELRR